MNYNIIFILIGVSLNASAQLLLKQAMEDFPVGTFSISWFYALIVRFFHSPYLILGIGCYIISVLIWLQVLSKVEVSYAYPWLSLGYIISAIGGKIFWNENVGTERIIGILLVCLGVYFISRTS